MIYKQLLFFVLFFTGGILIGQQISIDSTYKISLDTVNKIFRKDPTKALIIVNRVLEKASKEEERYHEDIATALRQKAVLYQEIDLDSQMIFSYKSMEIAEKYENWRQYLMSKSNLADDLRARGNFTLSDSIFQSILNHPNFNQSAKSKIIFLLQYTALKQDSKKLNEAIHLLEQAMNLSKESNVHDYDAVIFNKLANIHSRLKNHDESLTHHKNILSLLKIGDPRIYSTYNNIANQYISLNELDSASLYLNLVLAGTPKESSLIYTYQSLSNLAQLRSNFELGLDYSRECLALSDKLKRPSSQCKCQLLMAQNHYKLQNYYTAKSILSSIEACNEKATTKSQLEFQELYLRNELKLSNRADLLKGWDAIMDSKDSLTASNAAEKLRDLEAKYQNEKKEAENQLLKKDNDLAQAQIAQQRTFLGAAGVILLSLALLLWNLVTRSKERKKNIATLTEKNEAIQALNQEITHRTKNHLALATALLSKGKTSTNNPLVKATLTENENRLRTLTLVNQRLNQANSDKTLNLKDYLQELCDDLLFSLRNNKAGELSLQCDNIQLDSEKVLRLGLITNELITNTIKHAKPQNGKLEISLAIQENNHNITYHYKDNGNTQPNQQSSTNSKGMSLLASMWEQLQGSYTQSFAPHYELIGKIGME